ncbi:uncharacterized protein [Palaemon carinicauda]|uniref:uncharacterized protein isoform X2 n=1 Tax=Palaemon carinicauda TaxID=392227 RepID=UPI0035B67E29
MKITLLFVTVLAFLCFVDGKPHNEGKRAHQIKRAKEHEMSNRMGHGDHHRREHSIAHKTDLPHRTDIHEVHKTHKLDPASHKTEGHKSSVHKKAEAIHRRGDGVHKTTSGSSSSTSPVRDIKKDLHLQHVTEHNIQKKQHDDKQQKAEVTGSHLITNRMPSGGDVPSHILTNRTPQVSANLNSSTQATSQTKNITKDGIPMESERLIHVTPRPPKVHKINKPHHKPTPTTALKTNTSTVHQRPSSSKAKAHKPPKKYSPKKHGWKKSARKEKGKDKAKEKRERREKRNKALHHAVIAKNL